MKASMKMTEKVKMQKNNQQQKQRRRNIRRKEKETDIVKEVKKALETGKLI